MQQDMVINELAHIAFSHVDHFRVDDDTGDLVLTDGAPFGALAAVQSVRHRKRVRIERNGDVITTHDSEIRLWDKVTALRLLGRHVGLFNERVEHSGPNGNPTETVVRIERMIVERPMTPGCFQPIPNAKGADPALDEPNRER